MSQNCKTYKHPIIRDGLSQESRRIEELLPDQLELIGLNREDWLNFTHEMGALLRFYDADRPDFVRGDWQSFWPDKPGVKALLEQIDKRSDLEPHLALYLSFLRLLEHSRSHFNQLSRRHLDFYYRRVLQLAELPHRPDQVHVLFELAKRAEVQQLPKGSLLDAGKDVLGKPLLYTTDEELIVNRIQIAHLRQIFFDEQLGLRHAPVANSADGLGAELPEDNPQWPAFGNADLPAGRIGLALAARELRLEQGDRLIRVDFFFTRTVKDEVRAALMGNSSVFLTGEKGWLGPYALLSEEAIDIDQLAEKKKQPKNGLSFYIQLREGDDPVMPYQAELHGESYNTQHPVLRLLLNEVTGTGVEAYRKLRGLKLDAVEIQVEAHGLRENTVENDNARMDPAKPFIPFGPLPTVGSNFYVGNAEVFDKGWEKIRLNIAWKGKPNNFKDHYEAYVEEYLRPDGSLKREAKRLFRTTTEVEDDGTEYQQYIANDSHFTVATSYRKDGRWIPEDNPVPLFVADSNTRQIVFDKQSTKPVTNKPGRLDRNALNHVGTIKARYAFRSNLSHFLQAKTMPKPTFQLAHYQLTPALLQLPSLSWSSFPKAGFLKLRLNQHFFHKSFPELSALSLTGKDDKLPVPNRPYTPEMETLTLDYVARVRQTYTTTSRSNQDIYSDFADKKIQLFHDQVFGQTEEHLFLKQQQRTFSVNKEISLLPEYRQGGELLLALEDAELNQTVSLLIQVAEGSENPLRDPLNNDTGIKWSVLCSDEWKPLEPEYKLKDTTNQFLRSGIVRLLIPPEATRFNRRLEAGYFWIRARLNAPLDSVCRLLGIHPQAVSATFFNQGNELSHLVTGLAPGTISKLKDRLARIKKVEQPYASFGGRSPETESEYYQRVSERLRHKDRAVTIWDYEHLVLQEFPKVYKVKCLSHTDAKAGREWMPGAVSMVIIPRIHPDNAFDRLRPRASQQLLTEIEDFLAERISMHVEFDAVNAEFETVKLDLAVRFRKDYDPNFYQEELNTALIGFLSPWAADPEADIRFGGTIYRSAIIQFLEQLEYVDYISDLKITHRDAAGNTVASGELRQVSASNARAILVSANQHKIDILQTDCP
ncbi:baseplate J/gp47 family protein [Flavilitoribacter nigricans]|uniref:Uncharacterized protein n=1 Tax=Flavilitoribacter nigricans (strain ATCC 23147 / DSM 23189 / NBRC 102662 / NCIMB 1420 / SS-2) TaxID=1122177 RepID=A0A2D0NCX6_FLAN2|nr:baseplate J/gp47 family protein [Flavilitoribacter nigricans]PHN06361.1 hypothetical protein CRP01_12385 [Flavilitoribacter nigricans DSM 23189 = NBRC 102662]